MTDDGVLSGDASNPGSTGPASTAPAFSAPVLAAAVSAAAVSAAAMSTASSPQSVTRGLRATRSGPRWFWSAASLALVLVSIGLFLRGLARDIDSAEFNLLEVGAVRVDQGPGWVDPRWPLWLEAELATLEPGSVEDPAVRASLRDALAALSFVAEVGEPSVVWPDGLRIAVRWRVPVACVRIGDAFAAVSEEGFVLPGEWPSPPAREAGFLPRIVGAELHFDEFGRAMLVGPGGDDGLSVALALGEHLTDGDWQRLGRAVIDVREARLASVEHPGIVLWLEGGRRVSFGRSPSVGEPGELPVERKLASLSRALARIGDPDGSPVAEDWTLADVRWDRPELAPRDFLGAAPEWAGEARSDARREGADSGAPRPLRGGGPDWLATFGAPSASRVR